VLAHPTATRRAPVGTRLHVTDLGHAEGMTLATVMSAFGT
jgi:hypothetical protein